jgi:hypothetical protein
MVNLERVNNREADIEPMTKMKTSTYTTFTKTEIPNKSKRTGAL